jgi:aryl-alcohol dehydrogenase-like predicted oxidoreductase
MEPQSCSNCWPRVATWHIYLGQDVQTGLGQKGDRSEKVGQVRYRKIAKDSIEISELSFGTGDNAGAMIHGSSRQQIELVAYALEKGINFFDTSAAYGRGAAEVNLGRVLADLGARNAMVSTKAFIPPTAFTRIGEKVTESLEDSLFRLRRDCVDVLLLHNPIRARPNPENPLIMAMTPAQALEAALPAMVKAREAGKCRMLGLACDESEVAAILPVVESGEFAMINFTYNLANPSAARPIAGIPDAIDFDGLFELTERHNVWIAVVRPLAGGALAGNILDQGLDGVHELSRGYFRMLPQVHQPMISMARKLAFLNRPPEQTLAEAAYRYILMQRQVTTVIGGFSEIGHIADAVAAMEAGPLGEADMRRIDQVLEAGFW